MFRQEGILITERDTERQTEIVCVRERDSERERQGDSEGETDRG